MRKHWKSIAVLVFLMALIVLSEVYAPKKIDWSPSYSLKHKKPFGSYAVFKVLDNLFPDQEINAVYVPVSEALFPSNYYDNVELYGNRYNYISLNSDWALNEQDVEYLLEFVEEGNSAFIAANFFSGKLADTLNFEIDLNFKFNLDSININFANPDLKTKKGYRFSTTNASTYFSSFDSTTTKVLGTTSNRYIANFIKVKFGEGYFYLNTIPNAFTNYHILYGNHEYIEKAFAYLPQQEIIWDEYYKIGRQEAQTPLRVILSNASLKWAYVILVIFVLSYILFEGKRKQRIIPLIEPLKNTTVEFTEIVGRLYFNKSDHHDLLSKKMKFFLEHIRNKYYLNTNEINSEFLASLSSKTGIPKKDLKHLFDSLSTTLSNRRLSENDLHRCNELIESFYQKTQV